MGNISETAYLVAMYRALESQRSDALFQDPFARALAGGQGKLLLAVFGSDRRIINAIAVRTYVMDQLILERVKSGQVDTVLNLGAGLDTRPYRLSLPQSLRWIEVDQAAVLAEKQRVLSQEQPVCRLQQVPLDLTDRSQRQSLFRTVDATSGSVLVITEGLLTYLSQTVVGEIAMELHGCPTFQGWLLEFISASMLRNPQTSWELKLFNQYFAQENTTPLLFAPETGADFFTNYGWQPVVVRSAWEELHRLHRGTFLSQVYNWLLKHFAKRLWRQTCRQSGVALLERSRA
ncbi:MAG: class I SAM-dependent methyltransferase [Leptolyngbyaceae cyanobacterium]